MEAFLKLKGPWGKKWKKRKKKLQPANGGKRSIPDGGEYVPYSNPPPPNSDPSPDEILKGGEEPSANNSEENKTEESPTTVEPTSADDKKLFKDIPPKALELLVIQLQPLCPFGKDYRLLADKMGYSNEYIKYLESSPKPVNELLMTYAEEGRTIEELLSFLKQIDRPDVVEDLEQFIEKTPPRRVLEERFQRPKVEERKTIRASYDAFICFDERDRAFVDELVKIMESEPYKRHVCETRRDLLPGGSRYEGSATAIEKNCRNVVLVWSRHYDDSDMARYESNVAMSMATGTNKKFEIIPVLIDDGYRENIPRSMSHFYYLDYNRLEKELFWNKLAMSLGWKSPDQY